MLRDFSWDLWSELKSPMKGCSEMLMFRDVIKIQRTKFIYY